MIRSVLWPRLCRAAALVWTGEDPNSASLYKGLAWRDERITELERRDKNEIEVLQDTLRGVEAYVERCMINRGLKPNPYKVHDE